MCTSKTSKFWNLDIQTNVVAIEWQVSAQGARAASYIQNGLAARAHARMSLDSSADRCGPGEQLNRVVHRRVGSQGMQ
jgi:hypothetical protein